MLTSILDAITRTPRRALTTAAVATVIAALPATAQAGHRWNVDVSVPVTVDPCPPAQVVYAPQPAQVWVEPVYRTVCDRQWVAPVYRTVDAQVWVPPVTASAPQRVFVPDQFGWRTVTGRDGWGRPYRTQQWVVVVPGHYEDRCDAAVVVTPGHYECVPQQQLVCDGHWANVERQELVAAGHWETRCDAVVAYPPPAPPRAEFRVRF